MTKKSLAAGSLKCHRLDEVLAGDSMVKIGSLSLGISGDRLKEWDIIKSLAKVVKILEKFFLMISFLYQY